VSRLIAAPAFGQSRMKGTSELASNEPPLYSSGTQSQDRVGCGPFAIGLDTPHIAIRHSPFDIRIRQLRHLLRLSEIPPRLRSSRLTSTTTPGEWPSDARRRATQPAGPRSRGPSTDEDRPRSIVRPSPSPSLALSPAGFQAARGAEPEPRRRAQRGACMVTTDGLRWQEASAVRGRRCQQAGRGVADVESLPPRV